MCGVTEKLFELLILAIKIIRHPLFILAAARLFGPLLVLPGAVDVAGCAVPAAPEQNRAAMQPAATSQPHSKPASAVRVLLFRYSAA